MAIIQCSDGHYYDNEKYDQCPHCAEKSPRGTEARSEGVTVALDRMETEEYAAYYVKQHAASQKVEMDEQRTVALGNKGREFVCGWLVCTRGVERGQDYRVYTGYNRIGRDYGNEIVIQGDLQITRKGHCMVVYEERKNGFYLVPQSGNLAYLNDHLLEKPESLVDGDKITVGESEFEFVAFCRGGRKWEAK